ncbi:MAG: hypothetical protein AAGD01_08660 [Acidobacteriota bacterium]
MTVALVRVASVTVLRFALESLHGRLAGKIRALSKAIIDESR